MRGKSKQPRIQRSRKAKKGLQAQLLAKKWLISLGYLVHEAKKAVFKSRGRFISLGEDLFGCLDLLAINGERTWGVQVTTQNGVYARKKKIEGKGPWFPSHWQIGILVHRTESGVNQWRLYSYDQLADSWRREEIDFPSDLISSRLDEVKAKYGVPQ